MTLEVLIDTLNLKPENWIEFPDYKFRQYFLWRNEQTGASIALLDYEPGGGVPVKHSHASNQFMYCLEGQYEYTDTKLVLQKGSFYMNPKDHPHGPTIARSRCLLLEIYDGPHYYEKPSFHTDDSISGFLAGQLPADKV